MTTMPEGYYQNRELKAQAKKMFGTVLIILGIFTSILGFIGGTWQVSIMGFIINLVGLALVISGNREQGRGTTVIGGGFVSSG